MLSYIFDHPDYIFLLGFCTFLVIKVINIIIKDDNQTDEGDDDGGILLTDPVLDLPPGVTLPVDTPTPELELQD